MKNHKRNVAWKNKFLVANVLRWPYRWMNLPVIWDTAQCKDKYLLYTCGVTSYKPSAWLLVAARVRPKYGDVHSQMWHPPVHSSRKHVPWTRTAWRDGAKNFSPSISFWNQNKELHPLENTKALSISYLVAVHKDRQLNPKSLQLTTTSHIAYPQRHPLKPGHTHDAPS